MLKSRMGGGTAAGGGSAAIDDPKNIQTQSICGGVYKHQEDPVVTFERYLGSDAHHRALQEVVMWMTTAAAKQVTIIFLSC